MRRPNVEKAAESAPPIDESEQAAIVEELRKSSQSHSRCSRGFFVAVFISLGMFSFWNLLLTINDPRNRLDFVIVHKLVIHFYFVSFVQFSVGKPSFDTIDFLFNHMVLYLSNFGYFYCCKSCVWCPAPNIKNFQVCWISVRLNCFSRLVKVCYYN